MERFSRCGSGITLRSYQVEVARAIVGSILQNLGLTFVVIFPRQSGKNELQAQINRLVRQLSGGNQQKVILAKWLLSEARVLILDEPTRGVDVATKVEIYRLISDLADRGVGILLISSELPEILGMSDRALVMREGALTGEFPRAQVSEERLLACAAGVVQ